MVRTVLLAFLIPATSPAQFTPPRALPMPFAEKRAIDLVCDNDGSGSTLAKRRSNKAKNNFSAPAPALALSFDDFAALQKTIDDDPNRFPPRGNDDDGYAISDRTRLRDLVTVRSAGDSAQVGEGKRVVLTGLVVSARHANSWPVDGDGESVNCNSERMNRNDIHIELVDREQDLDDRSKRVTAEISPHFRPIVWERFDTDERTAPHVVDITDINGNKPLAGRPGITDLKGKRVRIYGHLYFDDVHRPCRANPCSRLSTWEIHPVYAIDVHEKGEWVPFHEWAAKR